MIDTQYLEKAVNLLKSSGRVSASPGGSLLLACSRSLLSVRQSLLEGQSDRVKEAIDDCRDLLKKEVEYIEAEKASSTSISYFGCLEKQFIQLACDEIDLIDDNLRQEYLIYYMSEALETPGIGGLKYPFDLSHIETSMLENAVSLCRTDIPPICEKAVRLFQVTETILTLRKFVLERDWRSMKSFMSELAPTISAAVEGLSHEHGQQGHVRREMTTAKRVMSVSDAMNKAFAAYSSGYLYGTIDSVEPSEDKPIRCNELKDAIDGKR